VVSRRIGVSRVVVALAIAAIGVALIAGTAVAIGGRPFSTELTGEAERPAQGDPDGEWLAVLDLNQGMGTICYDLSVTAAHIHFIANPDRTGPVVVGLAPPTNGSSSACATVSEDLIKKIRQDPENYYVNVHNAEFTAGALRGDLFK
jgi:CHRD domain